MQKKKREEKMGRKKENLYAYILKKKENYMLI